MCLGPGDGSFLDVGLMIGFLVRGELLVNDMGRQNLGMVCSTYLAALRLATVRVWYRGAGLTAASSKLSKRLTPNIG
jgi:hypothetical protein